MPVPEIQVPGENNEPIPVSFSKEQANYLLHVVDFYRTVIEGVVNTVPPLELVFILAFLQAAIETQAPEGATEAFNEARAFFQQVYPTLMRTVAEAEGAPEEGNLLIVVPKPSPASVAVSPAEENPRIIIPGSGLVN